MRTATLRAAVAGLALAAAGAALAADADWKKREYPALGFAIETPAVWGEAVSADPSSVKFEVEGKASVCEISLWKERKVLDDVEKNLRDRADQKHWKQAEEPKRAKIDGCDAFLMLVDIVDKYPVRQLFVVIDEPHGTYLLTYGDLPTTFDRAMIERVATSFRRFGSDATTPADPGAWGCAACKKGWPPSMKFCGDCGARNGPLKRAWGCPACRREWPEGQRFCGDCGGRNGTLTLRGEGAAAPKEPPKEPPKEKEKDKAAPAPKDPLEPEKEE